MAIDKLNIPNKTDNAAKKKMVHSNTIGANETLLANEVNQIVAKTNELVEVANNFIAIEGFEPVGRVATYTALSALTNLTKGDAYQVDADGLIYIWSGSAFQPQEQGFDLNVKPKGKVQLDDELAVSGKEVFEFISKKELNNHQRFFSEQGYLSKASGNILPDVVRISTPFLPIKQTDVIPFKTFIPVDITTIANVCLYNENKGLIIAISNNDLNTITVSDYPTAKFIRFCTDNRFEYYINFDFNANLSIKIEENKDSLPLNNKYKNNVFTQQASANFLNVSSGGYGNSNATYTIKNKTTNGVLHLAFRFRINENVNTSLGIEKPFVRFNGKDGSYLEYYLLAKETSQFTGGEQVNSPVETRSPIPYYNSRFGVKSSLAKTQLNKLLPERTYQYQGSGLVQTTKPIAGKDIFSIKIDAVDSNGDIIQDTTSNAAQTILQKWSNAYIEVTPTSLVFKNEVEGIEYTYLFSTYGLVRSLFEQMYRDLNGMLINGAKIRLTGINVGSFNDNITSASLLKHKYYLSTQYARLDGARTFYDSFPAYIVLGIDNSWHTFEIVALANKDELLFCIDGQYQNPDWGNQQSGVVTGMRSFINNVDTITIGGGLNIQVRDLIHEFNEFSDVTPCRVSGEYNTVYFSSKMHPLVWNFFGHDLYHSDYSGGAYSLYTQRVSQGGKMPDEIFDTSGRKGDDFHTIDRTAIFQPTWLFESNIVAMLNAGFKPITYQQYKNYANTGVAPFERCFVIGFDDFPTYIYSRPELKRVFTKYGIKPYLALELGWYVDENAPTTSYNASDWIAANQDTNEHRLLLQKRLLSLQNDGWGIELHGAKEGFVFRGSTYNEMIGGINETFELADYLGVESSSWCIAGNFQTPNALKLFEHNGIEMATSTIISPSSPAFSPYYMPRTLMPSSYYRQRVYFPLDN